MSKEKLTVLVPAHNEEANIADALNVLSKQVVPEGFTYKVMILPNGCTDATTAITQDFINADHSSNVIWQVKELAMANKNEALNAGLSETVTDLVIYTDGDCRVNEMAVSEIYNALSREDRLIVAGGLDVPDFSGLDTSSLLYQFQMVQQIRREERGRTMPVGRLIGFKRRYIDKFPGNIQSEDSWLALSVAQRYSWSAVRVLVDAEVYFAPPLNWVDYLRQQSRYEASFDHLLSCFPKFDEIYADRLKFYKLRQAEEIDKSILTRMAALGIDPVRFQQSRFLIDEIISENSGMMRDLLVKGNGTWEPVITTKKFKTTV